MTTDQVENEPPLGEQQPPLPVLNYIEAFRPLVPTEEMQSTSQRLQHIFVTNGSPASFGLVVSKQWRADRANGRTTWAVVGTALEVELLQQDLISGAAADVPGESIGPESVWTPSLNETISGIGVVIVTFEHLVACLSEFLQEDRTWQWDASCGSPTVVMNFGWGNMSYDMAFACPLLARLIKDTMLTGPQVIMACTVSSDDRPYFGRSWRHVEMQEVRALTTGSMITPKFYLREGIGNYKVDGAQKITTLLSEISNNNDRAEGQRTLLLVDPSLLSIAPWVPKPLFANRAERLRGDDAGDIALDNKTPYAGQVGRISDVIIYPYADGFTHDGGQIVRGQMVSGFARSQAEINYHSRYNQESDTQPRVHIMAREEDLGMFPAHCESSAAHTLHLAQLLVCCKFIWPDVPLAELPVLLPQDKNAVFQQLENLSVKGIMNQWHDSFPPQSDRERYLELYEGMVLTPLGRTTAAILMKGVQSLHSAHLMAQLLDTTGEYRALNKTSGPVVEAVLAFAVITEVNRSDITTLMTRFNVNSRGPGDRAWFNDNLRGISENTAGRGPIWLAVGLWQMLVSDHALRGPLEHVMAMGWPQYPAEVHLNGDSISLDVKSSVYWDIRLLRFSRICTFMSDLDLISVLGETPLANDELLAVEVAIVKAFMDRIMILEYHGEDHGGDFRAWDLASGHRLGQPPGSQWAQIWWGDCHGRDEWASFERPQVVFCVYTVVLWELQTSSDGRSTRMRAPVDATYVSAYAVRLAFKGNDASSKVNDPMSYLRLLRDQVR